MGHVFEEESLDIIDSVLKDDIMGTGANCVFLLDLTGNIISSFDSSENEHDLFSLAALAAANFVALNAMAKLIGEDEFSVVFHKGKKENIHFSKVLDDFLLAVTFGEKVSMGTLRLKVDEAQKKLQDVLNTQKR